MNDRERAEYIGIQIGQLMQLIRPSVPDADVNRMIQNLNATIREDERAKWGVGEYMPMPRKGVAA